MENGSAGEDYLPEGGDSEMKDLPRFRRIPETPEKPKGLVAKTLVGLLVPGLSFLVIPGLFGKGLAKQAEMYFLIEGTKTAFYGSTIFAIYSAMTQ